MAPLDFKLIIPQVFGVHMFTQTTDQYDSVKYPTLLWYWEELSIFHLRAISPIPISNFTYIPEYIYPNDYLCLFMLDMKYIYCIKWCKGFPSNLSQIEIDMTWSFIDAKMVFPDTM